MRGITAGLLMLGKTRAVEIMEAIDRADRSACCSRAAAVCRRKLRRPPGRRDRQHRVLHGDAAGRPQRSLVHAGQRARLPADPRQAQPIPRVRRAGAVGPCAHGRIEPLPDFASPSLRRRCTSRGEADRRRRVAARGASAGAPPRCAQPRPRDRSGIPRALHRGSEARRSPRSQRMFPMWEQNPLDQDSLARAPPFHTLKGSGRMVGARAHRRVRLVGREPAEPHHRQDADPHARHDGAAARSRGRAAGARRAARNRPCAAAVVARVIEAATARVRRPSRRAAAAAPALRAGAADLHARPAPRPCRRVDAGARRAIRGATPAASDRNAAAAPRWTASLHEIYPKETASHLAIIRDFIARAIGWPPHARHRRRLSRLPHAERHCEDRRHAPWHPHHRAAEPLHAQAVRHAIGLPTQARGLNDAWAAIQHVASHRGEHRLLPRSSALAPLHGRARGGDRCSRTSIAMRAGHRRPLPRTMIELAPTARTRSQLDWSYDNPPRGDAPVARRRTTVADDDAPLPCSRRPDRVPTAARRRRRPRALEDAIRPSAPAVKATCRDRRRRAIESHRAPTTSARRRFDPEVASIFSEEATELDRRCAISR